MCGRGHNATHWYKQDINMPHIECVAKHNVWHNVWQKFKRRQKDLRQDATLPHFFPIKPIGITK